MHEKTKYMKKWIASISIIVISSIIGLFIANKLFLHLGKKTPVPPNPSISENGKVPITNEGYSNQTDHRDAFALRAKMEFNSYMGYVPTPNFSGNGYHTNAQRFRYDDDLAAAKPSSEIRVFITGGSTGWGFGVRQHDTYNYVAERVLNTICKKKKIRMISAAVSSYVSTQEAIRVMTEITNYEPDIIVMFTGVNDAYAGYRNWKIERHYDPYNLGAILSKSNDQIFYPTGDYNTRPPEKKDYDNLLKYASDITSFRNNLLRNQNEAKEILFRNIRLIKHFSNELNADFIFYLQPYLYHTSKTLTKFEKSELSRYESVHKSIISYSKSFYDLILGELKKNGEKLDINYAYADVAIANNKDTLFIDHCHFGDKGSKLIGEHLAKILIPLLNKRGCECAEKF